jgi:hypothetical protein
VVADSKKSIDSIIAPPPEGFIDVEGAIKLALSKIADHDVITMMPVRAPHDAMSSVGSARARREISMSSDM